MELHAFRGVLFVKGASFFIPGNISNSMGFQIGCTPYLHIGFFHVRSPICGVKDFADEAVFALGQLQEAMEEPVEQNPRVCVCQNLGTE